MKRTLIIGLGNPLQGDDGVGCRVAKALEACPLPPDVEVLDGGTPGVGLLNLFEGRRRVVVIDAAEMGREPGTVIRFRPEDVSLTGSTDRLSLHRSGVADAIQLARALKLDLPEIDLYGVQPARVGWNAALSPQVEAAVAQVVAAVLNQIA